jgi:hypothetical protein
LEKNIIFWKKQRGNFKAKISESNLLVEQKGKLRSGEQKGLVP